MSIQAIVRRKRKSRRGKGFSGEELKEIGLTSKQALKLRIPIDTRRSTKHEENVETLKTHLIKDLERKQITEVLAPDVLVNLDKIEGIDPKLWKRLKEAGINRVGELAASSPDKIVKAIGVSQERASGFIENARSVPKKQKTKKSNR